VSKVIACDLGSNTLRIVLWDCQNGTRVKEFERIVRTAQDLHKTGRIGESAIARIFGALEAARHQFDFKTHPNVCVTTQALRQARNRIKVLDAIKSNFGLNFRIIDGQEEANLTRLGVESALDRCNIESKSYVLMDLGGGSLELTCKDGLNIFSQSFPFGIVTLSEANPTKQSFENALEVKLNILKRNINSWPKPSIFIATAGTPTTLAAYLQGIDYHHYNASSITGTKLSKKSCEEALSSLEKLPHDERERWVGVGRMDLIVAGTKILTGVMDIFEFEEMIVVDDGLREGVAIAFCNTL
jgi:exopolyphosphatase/guanosine-5'-triphosphate,3'-diphosphate pyrophosphatase